MHVRLGVVTAHEVLPRVEAQLRALALASGAEARLRWLARHGAFLKWCATAAMLSVLDTAEVAHTARLETLIAARGALETALFEAEATREEAVHSAVSQLQQRARAQLVVLLAVGVRQTLVRQTLVRQTLVLATLTAALGRWARVAAETTWAEIATMVSSSHAASSLRSIRRVGGLAAAGACEPCKNWERASLDSAWSRWQAMCCSREYCTRVHELTCRAEALQRRAEQAVAAEVHMRSLVDEGAHRSTVAERQMATSRVTAGAKLDTLTRERDEARAQVKKVEQTLLEARAVFERGKADVRFAQERLGKEQQSALTTALKVAEKARLAQLLRVVRTAHCPSLAAFLASWRAAAVAEQVARNYYHAAAVAGNYYYAQGAVSGAIAAPQEEWRLYAGAHEEY
ncbi:hypothetical protein Ctob_016022, partial [Chrysochromulina tobinii]